MVPKAVIQHDAGYRSSGDTDTNLGDDTPLGGFSGMWYAPSRTVQIRKRRLRHRKLDYYLGICLPIFTITAYRETRHPVPESALVKSVSRATPSCHINTANRESLELLRGTVICMEFR